METGEKRRGPEESCMYMTNKALDIKKITIIKRGKRTNPANKTPFFLIPLFRRMDEIILRILGSTLEDDEQPQLLRECSS